MKEIDELIFFEGTIYSCIYNEKGKFSQSQIALLLELLLGKISLAGKINVWIASPGLKDAGYEVCQYLHVLVVELIQDSLQRSEIG